jgi:hypothetical protein
MRHTSPFLAPALLLATALAGQQKPTFHLPAGDYRLEQLLAQCEQAVKAPIVVGELGSAGERTSLRLQCDLALPADAWEDVLGSLLIAQGVVLTFDAELERHEVLAAPMGREVPSWVAERARAFAANAFLARPSHQGPVRVAMPGGSKQFALASAMLRPMAVGMPGGLRVEQQADDVVLVGLGAGVRSAILALATAAPELATQLPKQAPLAWPRAVQSTTQSLPAGKHTLAAVVDCLARATGRNLLLDAALAPELSFEVATTITGDVDAVEAVLTKVLWQHQVVALGLAPAHGLFLVQQVTPLRRPAAGMAVGMNGDEVLARPELLAYVQVVYQPRHVGLDKVVPAGLAVMRAGAGPLSCCEALGLPDGLLLRGLTSELRPVLARLQEVDRAP